MADPVDFSDPCARAAALRDALNAAVIGGVRRVRFQNGDTVQETEFSASRVADLREELRTAERECGEATGAAPRRHAITVGALR